MAKNLTTSSQAQPLTASSRMFLDQLSTRRNAIERSPTGALEVSDRLAAPEAEIAVYRRRYDEIMVSLNGAGRAHMGEVVQIVTQLFLLFPLTDKVSLQDVVQAYAMVLATFPLWVIDKASKRVVKSGATFRPSCPEIMKLCEDELAGFYTEAAALREVIEAVPYHQSSETERHRVVTGFMGLMADLLATNVIQHGFTKTREQAERDVDAGFPQMREPLTLSDEAMKAFVDEDIEF